MDCPTTLQSLNVQKKYLKNLTKRGSRCPLFKIIFFCMLVNLIGTLLRARWAELETNQIDQLKDN